MMIIGVASKRLIRRMAGEVRSTKLARAGKPGTDRAQVHRQSVEAPIAIHTAEWARGQKGQQDRFKNSLSDAMAEWPHFRIEGNGEAYRPT